MKRTQSNGALIIGDSGGKERGGDIRMRRGREVELLLAHAIVLSIYYPSLMDSPLLVWYHFLPLFEELRCFDIVDNIVGF